MDARWAPELEMPDPDGPAVTRHRSNHGLRRALPFIGMMLGSAIGVTRRRRCSNGWCTSTAA